MGLDRDRAEKLLAEAKEALKNAHAPHSGFKVGAALLDASGNVYTGCNIENPSLTLTICAERVALYKAISEGARDFKAIAVVSSDVKECMPCGLCRQALFEFAPQLEIITETSENHQSYSINSLLPNPFKK